MTFVSQSARASWVSYVKDQQVFETYASRAGNKIYTYLPLIHSSRHLLCRQTLLWALGIQQWGSQTSPHSSQANYQEKWFRVKRIKRQRCAKWLTSDVGLGAQRRSPTGWTRAMSLPQGNPGKAAASGVHTSCINYYVKTRHKSRSLVRFITPFSKFIPLPKLDFCKLSKYHPS